MSSSKDKKGKEPPDKRCGSVSELDATASGKFVAMVNPNPECTDKE